MDQLSNRTIDILRKIKEEMEYNYIKNLDSSKYPLYLKKKYKKSTGKQLDLVDPKKYTEKIQYAKLHLNSPLKTRLTDKYLVRNWVKKKIGSDYLIPLLGTWDSYTDINFSRLPNKFVLKTNHGSGWNLIVEDKHEINHKVQEKNFSHWLNRNYAYAGDLQLHYKYIQPKIIAESFIQDSKGQLDDYKFFCFDGEVYFCWFFVEDENDRYGNIYDLNWTLQPWSFKMRKTTPYEILRPKNYDKMIEIAKILSKGFSHARVDLYNVDGAIFFGEMTFTSSGGYNPITPEKYDYKVGDLWNIHQ